MIAKLASVVVALVAGFAPIPASEPVTEDSPSWDCRTMGNLICGPGDNDNPQGFEPGRYEAGVLVETWPEMLIRCGHSDICLGA